MIKRRLFEILQERLGEAPAVVPDAVQGYFYRTSGGAEVDLVLTFPNRSLWAVEIKRSLSPRPDKGFYSACGDLRPERRFLVYPGDESYSIGDDIQVVSLTSLMRLLAGSAR